MKSTRILIAVSLAGLLAAGSTTVFACGDRGDHMDRSERGDRQHGPGGFGPMRAISQLDNLSDDQRKQLEALQERQRKEMEQVRKDHEALREAMDKAPDAKTLRPLAERQGKFVTDMIMKRQELRVKVDKILTPAQRIQLQEIESKRQGERGPRW